MMEKGRMVENDGKGKNGGIGCKTWDRIEWNLESNVDSNFRGLYHVKQNSVGLENSLLMVSNSKWLFSTTVQFFAEITMKLGHSPYISLERKVK